MILWCILRKTYGWHKKQEAISITQFQRLTGLKRASVYRAMRGLLARKLIGVSVDANSGTNLYKFNKDFEVWKGVSRKANISVDANTPPPVSAEANKAVSIEANTIKRKERNIMSTISEDSPAFKLSRYLSILILANFPKVKPPHLQRWARDVDLMIRIDQRDPDDIGKVIEWSQKDEFWKSNILSTKKLREKFDVIQAKMGGLR